MKSTALSQAFAVWLTGLPASGKSAIAEELSTTLAKAGFTVERLESDAVRRVLTPNATYSPDERTLVYRAIAFLGARLVAHGVPVIVDATANRRAYRDFAKTLIPHFLEVAVVCPLGICQQRDRKGTYRRALEGKSATVPGLQESYEPPLHPDVIIDTTALAPHAASQQIMEALRARGWLLNVREGQA